MKQTDQWAPALLSPLLSLQEVEISSNVEYKIGKKGVNNSHQFQRTEFAIKKKINIQ